MNLNELLVTVVVLVILAHFAWERHRRQAEIYHEATFVRELAVLLESFRFAENCSPRVRYHWRYDDPQLRAGLSRLPSRPSIVKPEDIQLSLYMRHGKQATQNYTAGMGEIQLRYTDLAKARAVAAELNIATPYRGSTVQYIFPIFAPQGLLQMDHGLLRQYLGPDDPAAMARGVLIRC